MKIEWILLMSMIKIDSEHKLLSVRNFSHVVSVSSFISLLSVLW